MFSASPTVYPSRHIYPYNTPWFFAARGSVAYTSIVWHPAPCPDPELSTTGEE